ncbi:MAG: ribonuclease P protein component [Bacteroidota bacterium]
MPQLNFNKKEHLKSRKTISLLFNGGSALRKYPLRVLWTENRREDLPLEAGFAVPKKSLKRAVDRNLAKRRMREAYRLNKQALVNALAEQKKHLSVMFLLSTDKVPEYHEIETAMKELLLLLLKKTTSQPKDSVKGKDQENGDVPEDVTDHQH